MELSLEQALFLLSERGREAGARLDEIELAPQKRLAAVANLRKEFKPEEAAALITLAELRQRAMAKFPWAKQMFFTPEALEQATAWPVALHRAERLHRLAPPGPVLDLGCGIGGDALALAQFRSVIAYEMDPVRRRFAQANAEALGVAKRIKFCQEDWTQALADDRLPEAAAAFADPARRRSGRRVFSLHHMVPPLAVLLQVQERIPGLAVKVAPGVRDRELPAGCSVEFVSHENVCKEAVLWFGPFATGVTRRWASVHREGRWFVLQASGARPPLGPLMPGQLLYEPDPAVIRAGAFAELCERLHAYLFDPQIAYLVGPPEHASPEMSPFVSAFWVDEVHPFGLKRLNARLQALGIGQVELKRRGAPMEPESLRSRLRLVPGGGQAVVFFTRKGKERVMILGRRVALGLEGEQG